MSWIAVRCGRLLANACAASSVRQKPIALLAAPSKKAIRRMKPGHSEAAVGAVEADHRDRRLPQPGDPGEERLVLGARGEDLQRGHSSPPLR
jgi:hypothetical protein